MSKIDIRKISRRSTRVGAATPFLIFGFVASTLALVGVYFYISQSSGPVEIDPILSVVEVGEFVSQVLDQGEAQSSENIEIRCEARARNGSLSVLTVVSEGSLVKGGDFLVKLDSTSFEKELEQQNISLANAQTGVIQAESNLKSAEATKKEYEEGTYLQEKLDLQNKIYDGDAAILKATQDLKSAKNKLDHDTKLQAKGYQTTRQLENSRNSVELCLVKLQQGELQKELAKEKLRVLETISFEKEKVQLDADIRAAEVKLVSEQKSLAVETEKLDEIQDMIEKCNIKVPKGVTGQVVFAKESSRSGNDWVLEEGTSVRQNQVLIRLPNPERMEVKALINEQSITQIEEGMAATIKVDALNNTTLKGVVTKVNQYAESSGWMSSSIRKYAVMVQIIEPPPALKPGMNASVTIQVQYEPEVLLAPIQCVYSVQDKQFCLAKVNGQWKTLEVEVGGDNSQMVYFTSGVEAGTELVMNPGAFKDYMELPEFEMETKIELPDAVAADLAKIQASKKGSGNWENNGGSKGGGKSGGKKAGGGKRGGGGRGFAMASSGAELIKQKDTDGDGKLTKDEAGSPYSFFFDTVDTDKDSFLSESELDTSIKNMKARMESGGGGFGGGGRQ
jgi:multidrug resistance efflux pump